MRQSPGGSLCQVVAKDGWVRNGGLESDMGNGMGNGWVTDGEAYECLTSDDGRTVTRGAKQSKKRARGAEASRDLLVLVSAGAFGLLHLSDLEWFSVDRQPAHSHTQMCECGSTAAGALPLV